MSASRADHPPPPLDSAAVRAAFPILRQQIRGKPFVYLDSAASAQKPAFVIDAMRAAMETQYANVHRGLHYMSERTTEAYEAARAAVATLIGADASEIVFTRNATEAINLVAHSFGSLLKPGQTVLVSEMEHHANLVPWQMLRDRSGIGLRVAPITDAGELDFAAYERELGRGDIGLVAITHMSNVLGTITPASRIAHAAHAAGARVLFDGSQAVVHRAVDMRDIDADFYVFTGHKLYGPTGVGVLFGKRALLEAMPPFLGGGDMIAQVSFERATWAEVPHKFEAGTPPILEAIGLHAAIDFVTALGFDAIEAHEAALTEQALAALARVPDLRVLGQAQNRGGVIAFTMGTAHAHDVATLLDRSGIAVRAGQHCAEPLLRRFGLHSTVRASFGVYTIREEIDALVNSLERVRRILQ